MPHRTFVIVVTETVHDHRKGDVVATLGWNETEWRDPLGGDFQLGEVVDLYAVVLGRATEVHFRDGRVVPCHVQIRTT